MCGRRYLFVLLATFCLNVLAGAVAHAADANPWSLASIVTMAREQRQEIIAARARADAAHARPAIVSALEDPMLSPSIDHYPFEDMDDNAPMTETIPGEGEPDMEETSAANTSGNVDDTNGRRYDWSVSIEQRFPLSRVLTHRRNAAEADANKASADADRTVLDVELGAINAFYMVQEKRQMAYVVDQQIALAKQLVSAASARYSAGTGNQSEVLRIEMEVARLQSSRRALTAEIRSAEAMLNASIGREARATVPELESPVHDIALPTHEEVKAAALQARPELRMGMAEVSRAVADVKAMQAMYTPMGMVRLGYASTMAEGKGAMLMVGVSLPLWREKLRSSVAEARAMEAMAHADLEGMKGMIAGEAIAARDQLEAAHVQYVALREDVMPRAQRLINPTLSSYASGQGNVVAVIEAVQALWDVQAEAVMAEAALGIAWARLHRMTGTTKENSP